MELHYTRRESKREIQLYYLVWFILDFSPACLTDQVSDYTVSVLGCLPTPPGTYCPFLVIDLNPRNYCCQLSVPSTHSFTPNQAVEPWHYSLLAPLSLCTINLLNHTIPHFLVPRRKKINTITHGSFIFLLLQLHSSSTSHY